MEMSSDLKPVLTSEEAVFAASNYEKVPPVDSERPSTYIGSNPRTFWRAISRPDKTAVDFMLALHLVLGIIYAILFLYVGYVFMCAASAGDSCDTEIREYLFPTTYLKHVGVGKQDALGRLAESHIALLVSAVLFAATVFHFWCALNYQSGYSRHLEGKSSSSPLVIQIVFAVYFVFVCVALIYVIASLAGVRDVNALNAIIVIGLLACFFAIMGYFKGCKISVFGTTLCVFYIVWTIGTSLHTQMTQVIPSDASLQWILPTTVLALVLFVGMFAIFAAKPLFPNWLPSQGAHEFAVVVGITLFVVIVSVSISYDYSVRFHAFKSGKALAVN
jgi:hypothetical protein